MPNTTRFFPNVRVAVLLTGVVVLWAMPIAMRAEGRRTAATRAAETPSPMPAPGPFQRGGAKPVELPRVAPASPKRRASKAKRARVAVAAFKRRPRTNKPAPFVWPVRNGWVTQRFGRIARGRFHHGIDIACAPGSTIRASRGGRSLLQGVNTIYGNIVVLGNPHGFTELYAHMAKVFVRPGRWVRQGQRVGLCGSTGHSTGPHLHFEVRWKSRFYDPRRFLP